MSSSPLGIKLDGVSAVFHHERRGDVTAVSNLDLEIRPGEFLTLLGASGCGKTTVLRMIAGFQRPTSGRVSFGGNDVTELAANRRDVGFVFQNYALFPHLIGIRKRRLRPSRQAHRRGRDPGPRSRMVCVSVGLAGLATG